MNHHSYLGKSNSFTYGQGTTEREVQGGKTTVVAKPNVASSWSSGPGRRVESSSTDTPTSATAGALPMPPVITDGIKVREVSIADTITATESIVDAARTIGIGLRAIAESTKTMNPVHKNGIKVHHNSCGFSVTATGPDPTSHDTTTGIRGRAVSDSVVGFVGIGPSMYEEVGERTVRSVSNSSAASGDSSAFCNNGVGEDKEQTIYERGRDKELFLGWESTRPASESPPRGRRRLSDRGSRSMSPPTKKGGKEPLKDLRGRMSNGVLLVGDYNKDKFSGCVNIEMTSRFDSLCAVGANVAKPFQEKPDDPEVMLPGRVVSQRVVTRSPLTLMYDVVFSSGVRQECDEAAVRKYVDNFSHACMYLDQGALKPMMVQFV